MKHEKRKCNFLRLKRGIAMWNCPSCNIAFECGNKNTKEMYCEGIIGRKL